MSRRGRVGGEVVFSVLGQAGLNLFEVGGFCGGDAVGHNSVGVGFARQKKPRVQEPWA